MKYILETYILDEVTGQTVNNRYLPCEAGLLLLYICSDLLFDTRWPSVTIPPLGEEWRLVSGRRARS